eukprot:CAMPEP_0118859472 /NCGR_PEP_ID=MMETSP1163-20130328/5705_1 /TAXON_ID=124430 /ORGANISM="Phaeomonas parva, Strain CCMP2877" /LENGTH=90 /DNA_ID=CAMNT_0006793065 /DNA_START=1 /DNA_END=273 /DNA_ORIENTATION=-
MPGQIPRGHAHWRLHLPPGIVQRRDGATLAGKFARRAKGRHGMRSKPKPTSPFPNPISCFKPPGVTEGGGDVHYFWTCCGHADKVRARPQ